MARVAQHADLDRGNLQILRQRVELRAQRGRGRGVHGLHALRGLHGQRGDGGHAVAIVRRNRFQIGADTGAAGRIKTGDGQDNG